LVATGTIASIGGILIGDFETNYASNFLHQRDGYVHVPLLVVELR
jgi:hypothetical protein